MTPKSSPQLPPDWDRLAATPAFVELLRAKRRFIVPATVFFLVYYFALPLLTGYMPELMSRKVIGDFSLAYAFALSQFPMAWAVAALYLRAAERFDRAAAGVIEGESAEEETGA